MTTSREAWERVLAAVEADSRRAEALLKTPAESFPDVCGPGAQVDDRLALPTEWLLPAAVELPPLDSMPPVPEELSDRILTLREQIMTLQSELTAALRAVPRTQPPKLVGAAATEVPAYIDRRL